MEKIDTLSDFKKITAVSAAGVILYFLLSGLLLSLLNIKGLWWVLQNVTTGQLSQENTAPLTDAFLSFQSHLSTPFTMLFWGGVGIVAYGMVTLLGSGFSLLHSEIAEAGYKIQGFKPLRGYWRAVFFRNGEFLLIAAMCLSYLFIFLRAVLPATSSLFYEGLYATAAVRQTGDILLSIIVCGFGLYLAVVTQKVLVHAWRAARY